MNNEVKRRWWQRHRGKQYPRRQKFVQALKNNEALETLTHEEKLLIKYYFGLDGEFKSLAEIGRECFNPPLDRHKIHTMKDAVLKKLDLDPKDFKQL